MKISDYIDENSVECRIYSVLNNLNRYGSATIEIDMRVDYNEHNNNIMRSELIPSSDLRLVSADFLHDLAMKLERKEYLKNIK